MNDIHTIADDIASLDNEATRDFVCRHRTDDVRLLALRSHGISGVNLPFALDQIAGWQTARAKLPTLAATDGIIYPPHLNMEQCSSEATARYKAALAGRLLGRLDGAQRPTELIDITGGLGIDFSFLAPHFARAVYVERDRSLCAIASHNFKCLGLTAAETVNGDGVAYLRQRLASASGLSARPFVFIDPARRDANGRKVIGIDDCTPDVSALKETLMRATSGVLLKLSPMLDWHAAARAFIPYCREVHIVSVGNECKELLLVLSPSVPAAADTQAIRLVCANDAETFELAFSFGVKPSEPSGRMITVSPDYRAAAAEYQPLRPDGLVGACLCVPNASIMKAGVFDALATAFSVTPVDRDSHLFVSSREVADFPGRRFRITGLTTLNKRELRQRLAGITQANIAVRNFPLSAAELRKRLKLRDGGSCYLFATTMGGRHVIFITEPATTPIPQKNRQIPK